MGGGGVGKGGAGARWVRGGAGSGWWELQILRGGVALRYTAIGM